MEQKIRAAFSDFCVKRDLRCEREGYLHDEVDAFVLAVSALLRGRDSTAGAAIPSTSKNAVPRHE